MGLGQYTWELYAPCCVTYATKTQPVFVYMQIGQRHFNAHAFVNVAIFLDLQETGSDGHKGLKVQDAHVAFGFDQRKGSQLACLAKCVLTCVGFSAIHS